MKRLALILAALACFGRPALADPAGAGPTPGTAGTQSDAAGCIYRSGGVSPVSGQQMTLGCDVNGNLLTASSGGGGTQAVNLTQVGGAAIALGSAVSADSLPVVIASDQGAVTVKQATASALNATVVGTGTLAVQNTAATPAGTNAIGSITNTSFGATQATASALNATVVGPAASGAAVGGNPLVIGGVFTTVPSVAGSSGLAVQALMDNVGQFRVVLCGLNSTSCPGVGTQIDAQSAVIAGIWTNSRASLYNGTSEDIGRSAQGAAKNNTGIGVTAVEESGRTYSHISTATTTTIKSGAGFLHTLVINTTVALGTITIYDNTAGSGTVIAVITNPATLLQMGPLTATYDIAFTTGLTIVTTGAQDLTVAYR